MLPSPTTSRTIPSGTSLRLAISSTSAKTWLRLITSFSPKLTVNGKFLHDTNPTIEAGGLFTSMPSQRHPPLLPPAPPGHQYNIGRHVSLPMPKFLDRRGLTGYSYGALISHVKSAGENFSQSPDVQTAIGSNHALPEIFLGRVHEHHPGRRIWPRTSPPLAPMTTTTPTTPPTVM